MMQTKISSAFIAVLIQIKSTLRKLFQRGRSVKAETSSRRNLFNAERARELAQLEDRCLVVDELQDKAKQHVFAASAQIAAARARLEQNPADAASHLAAAEQLISGVLGELSGLSGELHPPALGGKGLTAALCDYAASWSGQNSIPLEMSLPAKNPLPVAVELQLYRITQEALAILAGRSRNKKVILELKNDADCLRLAIIEVAVGIEPALDPPAEELAIIQKRVDALQAKFTYTCLPGKGAQFLVEVNLSQLQYFRPG